MNTDASLPGWLVSIVTGVISGFLSAFGSIAYFGGDTKATLREHSRQLEALGDGGEVHATLQAHDHRITTLENDVRYEVRAIRESMHGMRNDFHAHMQEMRKEMLTLMKALAKEP